MTARGTAQDERYHYAVEIWPTPAHREIGAESLRASTGLLSGSGAVISIDGRTFPPTLAPIAVTRYFSTTAPSLGLRFLWDRDTQTPAGLDLREAVGDLYLIDESASGTTLAAATLLTSGQITRYAWGDSWQALQITLSGRQAVDTGDWYLPGAELTSTRFPDIANTGDRDRAKYADGLLPVLVWAPVGSVMRVPVPVTTDEDNAVTGVSNLVPRRHHMGNRKPTNTSANEQFAMADPQRDGSFLQDVASSQFRKIPASAVDDAGDTYWYVLGDFSATVGSASVLVTNGATAFTASNITGALLREGYQFKGSTGGADDYLPVSTYDRPLGEFTAAYGGPTIGVAGAGTAIPLPGEKADATYWLPSLGGCDRGDGTPIAIVTEVLADWLRLADFPGLDVRFGDLYALTSRLSHNLISYTRRSRGSPWAKCLEVLDWLPVRPYLDAGELRFRWTGPPNPDEVVAELDLDDVGSGLWRTDLFSWSDAQPAPLISLNYHWDAYKQSFRAALTLDGNSTVARVLQCLAGVKAPGRIDLNVDTVESLTGNPIRLTALYLLYGRGHARRTVAIEADVTWRWLELGDVVQMDDLYWRVEGLEWGGDTGKIYLEEAPL